MVHIKYLPKHISRSCRFRAADLRFDLQGLVHRATVDLDIEAKFNFSNILEFAQIYVCSGFEAGLKGIEEKSVKLTGRGFIA